MVQAVGRVIHIGHVVVGAVLLSDRACRSERTVGHLQHIVVAIGTCIRQGHESCSGIERRSREVRERNTVAGNPALESHSGNLLQGICTCIELQCGEILGSAVVVRDYDKGHFIIGEDMLDAAYPPEVRCIVGLEHLKGIG